MLESITKDISVKLWCLYLVQHMLHQIKASQFYTHLGLQKTLLNPLANCKTQGLFKAFECFQVLFEAFFSRTFQDSPLYSSTFQACENPELVNK